MGNYIPPSLSPPPQKKKRKSAREGLPMYNQLQPEGTMAGSAEEETQFQRGNKKAVLICAFTAGAPSFPFSWE